ncbi:MAG: NAD(P)-dependent oxidoreductase [Deltaproteobacteria bacterium]|nr:NAD(P)-dependent oxidoreductase [Deltaproteobacteria bacterium]
MKKVGFIGMGMMGNGMATNLVNAGFEMCVYDVNPDAMKPFENAAKLASSPKEVAQFADVVMTMLPEPSHVEAVYLGENGLLSGAHEGLYLIDTSSVDPECSKKVSAAAAKEGVIMFDAPVGGSPMDALSGDLIMMAGGNKKDILACRDVLDAVGARTLVCGPVGTGSATKLANNLMTVVRGAVIVEGFTLAEKAGVDTKVLAEIQSLNVPRTNENMILAHMAKVVDLGFFTGLAHKDLRLAQQMAESTGTPTPICSLVKSLLQMSIVKGNVGRAIGAVVELYDNQ